MLFQHWITYGSREGREITADFSINAYISANEDIKEAFNGNMIASMAHYYEYGQHEERITTIEEAVAVGITVTTPSGIAVALPIPTPIPTPTLIPTPNPPAPNPPAPSAPSAGTTPAPSCYHQNYHYEATVEGDVSDEFDLFCCDDCDFTLPVSHDWIDGRCQYCNKAHNHAGEAKVVVPGSFTAANHSVVYTDCNGDAGVEAHNWADGICADCGYDCVHTYNGSGICTNCGITCDHSSVTANDINNNALHNLVCNICGKTFDREAHSFNNGVCDDCGYTCEHASMTRTEIAGNDAVHTLTCRTCGYSITEAHNYLQRHVCSGCNHTYSNEFHNYVNGDCTICGYQCPHTYVTRVAISGNDAVHNVVCDDCCEIVRTENHIFTNQYDHKCRVCNYTHSVTAHNYVDGYCAICGISCSHSYMVAEKPGDDTNHSFVCSFCGKVWRDEGHNYLYNHTCSDCHHAHSVSTHDYVYYSQNNGDHETCCRICGKTTYDDCADTDNDGKCDKCGYTVASHIPGKNCYDEDGDHICDYPGCGAPVGGVLPPWITP